MSVRITSQERKVALFDSASGRAFGIVFDSEEDAESFLSYCRGSNDDPGPDLRSLDHDALAKLQGEWTRVLRDEAAEGEEIMDGYATGHYSEGHIARYGGPS